MQHTASVCDVNSETAQYSTSSSEWTGVFTKGLVQQTFLADQRDFFHKNNRKEECVCARINTSTHRIADESKVIYSFCTQTSLKDVRWYTCKVLHSHSN